VLTAVNCQWRRQRSKEARSFRGQNILEPGHPDALLSSKKLTPSFSRRRQNTKAPNAAELVSLSKIKHIKRSAVRCGKFFYFPFTLYYPSKAKQ